MNLWQSLLNFVLCFSVGFAPTISLAATNVKNEKVNLVRDYYKKLDYKAGSDIGPWLEKNSGQMHFKMKTMMEKLQMTHPEVKLPTIEFSDYESNGKTYTRMIFKFEKGQETIDVYQKGDKLVFKGGGQEFDYNDIYYDKVLTTGNPNPMMTLSQLTKANAVNSQAATEYQTKFRDLVNGLASFSEQDQAEVSKQFSYVDLILQTAYAGEKDRTCIVAGNFSKISDKGYCGGEDTNKKELYCGGQRSQGFKCNPLVYGFQSDSKPVCVPYNPSGIPSIYVSQGCNAKFDLSTKESQKAYVDSILKNQKMMGIGEVGDFYKNLRSHISEATHKCGISEAALTGHIKEDRAIGFSDDDFLGAFPRHSSKKKGGAKFDYNEGHRTACKFLMNRLLLAKQAADCSENRTLAADSPEEKEKATQAKGCNPLLVVATASQPVTSNTDPVQCVELQKQASIVEADVAAGKIQLTDKRVQEITEKHQTNVCAFKWPPDAPEPQVVVKAEPPVKKDKNWCTETTVRKWTCGLGALALLAWLFRDRGGSSTTVASAVPPVLPPMTVGKPGETMVPNQRPTTRPASATGTN